MNSNKHGHPDGYRQADQASSAGMDRPMFANDPDDYAQPGSSTPRPAFDAHSQPGQQWQTGAAGAPADAAPDADPADAQAQGSADEQALLAEIEALRAELAEAETRAAHNHEQFVRASAEMENVRRRSKEEIEKARKFAIEGFAESLLPVCDSLEMSLKVENASVENIRQGAEATLRQLLQALERNKVVVVDPVGQRFDPNAHQAISMQPSADVAANHVVSVLQKGYLINDRVLRPAMVVVSQGG